MSQTLYIGLISGTSMDGVDAALVAFDSDGRPHLKDALCHPFPESTRDRLVQAIADPRGLTAPDLARLDGLVGESFADTAQALIARSGHSSVDVRAIGSHGQTLYHGAHESPPVSLQIGDPNIIAERSGIDVVADLRRRELAVGGQAAPLAPALHAAVFRSGDENRAVVNLGGIGNVTSLPADPRSAVTGFDTGPANCLMDDWIGHRRGDRFDADGRWASEGQVDGELLQRLMDDPYLKLRPPKSTGRETFNLDWLLPRLTGRENDADVQATLAEFTARTVCEGLESMRPGPERVLICGGGVHNRYLLERIQALMGEVPVESTAGHGLDPDWVEASLLAWLAMRHVQGLPGNIPTVTGAAAEVVLGALYPGRL